MLKILGIGDNVVDKYLFKGKMYPGGNALNVPVLAKRTKLNVQASYIGALGTDKAGTHVLASLISEGIDVSHIRVIEGENAYANVELVDGNRVFLPGNKGVSLNINLQQEDYEYAKDFDVVHTSVYSGMDDMLPHLKALNKPCIAYDYSDKADIMPKEHTYKYVDFAMFSGGDMPKEEVIERMEKIAKQGPKHILFTLGARGSMLYKNGEIFEQGVHRIEKVIDTMGAGDSYVARYLSGIYNGETTQESMQNAAYYATENCLVNGTFGYEIDI